uniref:Uncharacterized protein n=1 Tax=Globodera rostochiensis TaxID=31243 RepID=A0A914HAN4_GLORO
MEPPEQQGRTIKQQVEGEERMVQQARDAMELGRGGCRPLGCHPSSQFSSLSFVVSCHHIPQPLDEVCPPATPQVQPTQHS